MISSFICHKEKLCSSVQRERYHISFQFPEKIFKLIKIHPYFTFNYLISFNKFHKQGALNLFQQCTNTAVLTNNRQTGLTTKDFPATWN